MADPSRDGVLVAAKRQLDSMSVELLAIVLPLLHLPLRHMRELLQIHHALASVRELGFGEIRVRVQDGQVVLLERTHQSKPDP